MGTIIATNKISSSLSVISLLASRRCCKALLIFHFPWLAVFAQGSRHASYHGARQVEMILREYRSKQVLLARLATRWNVNKNMPTLDTVARPLLRRSFLQ